MEKKSFRSRFAIMLYSAEEPSAHPYARLRRSGKTSSRGHQKKHRLDESPRREGEMWGKHLVFSAKD